MSVRPICLPISLLPSHLPPAFLSPSFLLLPTLHAVEAASEGEQVLPLAVGGRVAQLAEDGGQRSAARATPTVA